MIKLLPKLSELLRMFIKPVTKNLGFFVNMVLLLIIPTLINVFCISPDYYIHHSPARFLGFYATRGASFPYILFIPVSVIYILNLLLLACGKKAVKMIIIYFYTVLGVLFIVNVFLLCNFKTMISPTILTLIKETNGGESSDFFATYLLSTQSLNAYMFIIVSILLMIIIERYHRHMVSFVDNVYIRPLASLFLLYIFLRSFTSFQSFGELFTYKQVAGVEDWYVDGYPQECNMLTNVIYSFYIDHISKAEIKQSRLATLECADKPCPVFNTKLILVIGESFSKHHSSLYGYTRKTNPYLEKERENGNLFLFSDVISPYNVTSNVMKNLFSTNSMMDNESWNACPIFPFIFKRAGYEVFFWDNQKTTETDISDYAIFSYIYDSKIMKESYTACNDSIFDYDMDLLNNFFRTVHTSTDKSLIMFHIKGQHAMAERKYPHSPEYTRFTPDSVMGNYTNKQKEQVAHYDNCTIYNDAVLHCLMDRVREDDCVIVYFSDHGEEVHDYRNHYGRTQEYVKTANILKYQYQVPFLIWCSDKYKELHSDIIANICAAKDKPFMIDNTCQILFNLAGIKSKLYISSRNLISPSYIPYKKRIVQNTIDYESIIGRP